MMTGFEGRVALVTGGSKGIGKAIAKELVAAGFQVAVTARSPQDLEAMAAEISGTGPGTVLAVPGDVRDPDACQAVVTRVVEELGGLDILINNAGVGIYSPINEMSVEDWRVQIDTNLSGVFFMSRAAIPPLKESEDAWIINIGSLAGRNTFAGGAAYNASKFGLLGMTEAMMLDLRYEGIRVSHIMPGSVDTGFGDSPPGRKEGWALTPGDVAQGVLDLLRYPGNALPSRIEMRPSRPPRKN